MKRSTLIGAGLLVVALACGTAVYRGDQSPPDGPRITDDVAAEDEVPMNAWVVDAPSALAAIDAGALVLDARTAEQHANGHVAGAVPVNWQAFSAPGDSERGDLHPDPVALQAAVDALGVRSETPVRVVGDPVLGWGEDGRIVWTLRTLGHTDVALVDGGHAALAAAGAIETREPSTPPVAAFDIRRSDRWAISTGDLRARVEADDVAAGELVLIDAREAREYAGETPYGEARGGHVPGAVHLHYKALLTGSGHLRPRSELEAELAGRGARPDVPVVVYCTGGVRSGWFVAVLQTMGYADVRNYAGSMWQWSAGPAEQFPLETD